MLTRIAEPQNPVFALCLLSAWLGSAGLAAGAAAGSAAALEGRPQSFAAIAKKTTPVVVNIFTTAQRGVRSGASDPLEDFFNRFFGDTQPRENSSRSLGEVKLPGGVV